MNEQTRIKSILLYLIFAAFAAGLLVMMRPFYQPVMVAVICSVLIYPVHRKLAKILKSDILSSVVSVFLIVVLIVGPFTYISYEVMDELKGSLKTLKQLATGGTFELLRAQARSIPFVPQIQKMIASDPRLSSIDLIDAAYSAGEASAAYLAANSISIIKNFSWFVFEIFIALISVFFILADSKKLLRTVRSFSPFSSHETEKLLARINDTVSATVFGGILVAMAQGLVGGIGFYMIGLPSPFLWGAAMAMLAMIPFLGAPVVWFPAAVVLLLQKNYFEALFLFVWGAFVVGLIDNILRPYIVGTRAQLHPLLVFFSAFGGLLLIGPLGLFVGPIILSMTLTMAAFFKERAEK